MIRALEPKFGDKTFYRSTDPLVVRTQLHISHNTTNNEANTNGCCRKLLFHTICIDSTLMSMFCRKVVWFCIFWLTFHIQREIVRQLCAFFAIIEPPERSPNKIKTKQLYELAMVCNLSVRSPGMSYGMSAFYEMHN